MSSSLDLAETLHHLGHNVVIGLTSSSIIYRATGARKCKTVIPAKNIYTVPAIFKRAIRKRNYSSAAVRVTKNIKAAIQNFLITLSGKKNFIKLLSNADIIIDAANFSGQGIALIKEHTNGLIVKNHAGSPKAFEDFWLTDEHLLEPADSNRSRYVAYCQQYDALLFQAPDQLEECVIREPLLKPRCFVLPPTCQEQQVLASRQQESPYQPGRKAIVCVGSIQPRKAQHLAMEAFSLIAASNPDADLHFVGGGLNSDYGMGLVKEAAQAFPQGRIYFHGHRQDYLRFMAHAELVIQTSQEEGVSRILREAMLLKRPLISFAISGTTSLLESGKEAVLVQPGDTAALAEAIADCLNHPSYAKELALAAYKRYLLNNSWAAYASKIIELVDHLGSMK